MTLRCLVTALAAATGLAAFAQNAPKAPSGDLNLRFANGIVAVAEEKIITVADVMREVGPYLNTLKGDPGITNEAQYNQRVEQLYENAIQELIDKVLIIKEFRKDEKRHIPTSYIDNAIADEQADRFEGDRSKFLSYLRAQGLTQRDYRKKVEEDIIYQYMQGQQRKSQSVISPVRIETYYNENKDRFYREDEVYLRMIQLTKADEDTDATLQERANQIIARFKAGDKFEELAKEFSKDRMRSKGGDWGWQKRSDFRDEFRNAAFALKKGEISPPVTLPEGVFVLFAEDRKFAGIQAIDEVRDQIERILVAQMSNASRERWLERLRRNGYVKHY